MFELALNSTERANKAALLLAHERYSAQFAPFVKGQPARLSYVQGQIEAMISQVAEEVKAEEEVVREQFLAFLNESVHSPKNSIDPGNIHHTDVKDHEEVEGAGLEEALNPPGLKREKLAKRKLPFSVAHYVGQKMSPSMIKGIQLHEKMAIDFTGEEMYEMYPDGPDDEDIDALNHMWDKDMADRIEAIKRDLLYEEDPEIRDEMFREMGELQFKIDNPVPRDPTEEDEGDEYEMAELSLRGGGTKKGDASWNMSDNPGVGTGLGDPEPKMKPVDQYAMMQCNLCERANSHFEGTEDEVMAHIQQAHAEEVAREQGYGTAQPPQQQFSTVKEAEVPRTDEDVPAAEPLPQTPATEFDGYVQELAERAAARKFSLPDDEAIHSIASQVGASPDEVKQHLVAVAVFGESTARNGEFGGDTNPPEGYEEVSAQGVGGRIDATEALIPVDLVVSKVAEKMNMQQDLAYNMIRDRYGSDLPDKYHASVAGEVHLYLPTQLAGNQQQPQDPEVGPTPQPIQPQAPAQPQAY
jgi:hypothetical protein